MPYMLDTNIAIHARDSDDQVLDKLAAHSGMVFLSAISLVELQRGLYVKLELSALRRAHLEIILEEIPVLPFDQSAAEMYGRIISLVGWNRARDFDRMIAAHAIAAEAVLVTANIADFRDIPGLKVENWAA